MTETLAIMAIVSAVIGAIASTVQGYWNSEGGYSLKKLSSAVLTSAFFAFGIVNLTGIDSQASQLGIVGLLVSNLLLGYGIDKAHSALDK
ncbi:MAG: hypothetical protein ACKO7N_02335 [Candidatus Nitrosotenuis sp.]